MHLARELHDAGPIAPDPRRHAGFVEEAAGAAQGPAAARVGGRDLGEARVVAGVAAGEDELLESRGAGRAAGGVEVGGEGAFDGHVADGSRLLLLQEGLEAQVVDPLASGEAGEGALADEVPRWPVGCEALGGAAGGDVLLDPFLEEGAVAHAAAVVGFEGRFVFCHGQGFPFFFFFFVPSSFLSALCGFGKYAEQPARRDVFEEIFVGREGLGPRRAVALQFEA